MKNLPLWKRYFIELYSFIFFFLNEFLQIPTKYQRNVAMEYNNNILLRCVCFIEIKSPFNVQILETTNEV